MKKIIFVFLSFFWISASFAQQQDVTSLLKRITDKANAGEAEAAYHLGMFYGNGIGVVQDFKEAFRWFKIAANKDDPLAAYELSAFYSGKHEDIPENDPEEAFRTIRKSAIAGYSLAQYDLGLMYLNFRNGTMGTKFIEMAADQGHPMAYQTLSLLKYRGDMTKRDLVGSRTYLKLFINVFGQEAVTQYASIISQIEKDLSPEQISISNNQIENWKPEETELSKRAQKGLIRSYEYAGMPVPQQFTE